LLAHTSLILAQSASASSANFYYSDGPWSGKVIDAETKAPIEGSVVVAIWYKSYVTPAGNATNYFNVIEVTSDKDGEFLVPKYKALNITPIIASIEGPEFVIFKPAYTAFPGRGYNYFNKYFPSSPLRVDKDTLAEVFKKGVLIELLKLKIREERLMNIPSGPTDVGSKKLPLLYKLINEERKSLGLEGEVWK
jgi:hypothetical protein